MNLRTGIFMVVASVACMCAMESESNAQGLQRGGGQLAARAVRAYAVRAIPGGRIARFVVQRGVRNNGGGFGGGQVFGGGTQGFGNQGFGLRNGLQAARLFRRF